MKHLLLIAAGVLLLVVLPLILWRLLDDPLARRVEPLIGTWRSSLDHRTMFSIRIDDAGGCICIERPGSRRKSIHSLHFDTCLYYMDADGRRIDLFYAPSADVLLLMPGGTFQRIHKPQKNE